MAQTEMNFKEIKNTFALRYSIDALIGEGGMSWVFRARHNQTGHQCALKILKPENNNNSEILRLFEQEIEICATLNHPNILRISYGGKLGNYYFMEMELLNGMDLHKTILRKGPLSQQKIASIGISVASALAYIHQKRELVHRDVKTANIFMDGDRPVLTDFGIACSYRGKRSRCVGMATIEYMSPEQTRNIKNIHPQNDLYSLGVVMYECLTGRVPFKGETPAETMKKIVTDQPVSVRRFNKLVSGKMESIISALLEKQPENRIQSAYTLLKLLNGIYRDGDVISAFSFPLQKKLYKNLYSDTVYVLTQLNGELAGKRYRVIARKQDGHVFSIIGRYHQDGVIPEVDIQEKTISRQHIEMVFFKGRTAIRHLYSKNPSYLNGKTMEAGVFYPIQPGQKFRMGNLVFQLSKRSGSGSFNLLGLLLIILAVVFIWAIGMLF